VDRTAAGRRTGLVLAAALLATTLVAGGASDAHAQETGWRITSFDVAIVLLEDGSFAVLEEISVVFDEERRGIFRTIPTRYGFDDQHERVIEVRSPAVQTSAGTPDDLQVDQGRDEIEMRIGHPDRWITGEHTYVISYTVEGALNRFDTHDELYWNVTGEGWPVPIERASARLGGVPFQDVTCFAGPLGTGGLCETIEVEPGSDQAGVATGRIPPGGGMTVVASIAPGTVDVVPPRLEERRSLRYAFLGNPYAIPLTIIVAILSLAFFLLLILREGRDRVTRGGRTIDGRYDGRGEVAHRWINPRGVPVRFRPPDELRPAQLGLILDESVDPVEISATIVDLAVRGHLTIEEEPSRLDRAMGDRGGSAGRVMRRVFRSRSDWTFRRRDPSDGEDLLPFERRLLDGLFSDGNEVALGELEGEFHADHRAVCDRLYDDAVERGWFPRSPRATRHLWAVIGVVVAALATGLVWLLATRTDIALVAVPLVVLGIAIALSNRWMPHRTPEGSRLLDETLGFREFISTAEGGRAAFAEEEGIFTRYLPYAVVFGVTDRWARAFADLGAEAAAAEAGIWYVGPHGAFPDVARLSSGLSDLSARATSLPKPPASSGSSGFGGGGSVGGGFGGGGGGSW
jgi:uncharacterized membrane protein YgcG